jgi:hypothetical protein
MGGSPLVCDDGNACTEDSCDTSSGCVSIDVVTATCDDGNPCTLDGCDSASGACVHTLVIPCTLVIPAGDYAADAGGGNLVSVAEFAIMATEVTLAEYVDCLLDIKCSEPSVGSGCNYGTSGRSEHPANCVTATQAVEYCASIGGSLPTEDQWKKAARGDLDSRIYPWGDTAPDCAVAIYNNGASGCGGSSTSPVGSLPAGMSPYGVQDMAGNVWEWVIPNDPCPTGQSFICGGGWNSPPGDLDIDGCKCTTLTQSSVIGVGHCVVPVP